MKKPNVSGGVLSPEQQRRYQKARRKLQKKLRPYQDAVRRAERLTADDYGTIINW